MGPVDVGLRAGLEPSALKGLDLTAIEPLLAAHFQKLAAARQADGLKTPVFALEHGLSAEERRELASAIRIWVLKRPPSSAHRLAWTVYATEIGYDFTGAEYWQTFESLTPGWAQFGERDWIRECFRQFQKTYCGIQPQGAWAEHFSIICWPITNAILPQDLQRDLARILFEMRHQFTAEFFTEPALLGRQISNRSWSATPRFQILAESHLLIGQIATALLLSDLGTSLIHPETLRRIAEDLERNRRSREWLRKARESAKDRRKIKGLGKAPVVVPSSSKLQVARQEVARLGLEPKLVVIPSDSAGERWRIFLKIPNLSHLLDRFPEAREILTNTRCTVIGSSERPLARGRVLFGTQTVQLSRWPRSDEVLLQFEKRHDEIDYLLRTECLLRPGTMWLFEVGADGNANERRSPRVRAGERYLIIRESGPFVSSAMTRPVAIDCAGIYAALLTIPSVLTDSAQQELRGHAVALTKALEVWPAGLTAAWWDGAGHAEWLAGERPCVGIFADHSVQRMTATLIGTEHVTTLLPASSNAPIFLLLPDLPLGQHTLHIATHESDATGSSHFGSLDFTFRVRETVPQDRQTQNGSIELQLEPRSPSLEDLWDSKLNLTLNGPLRRALKCTITLVPHDSNGRPFKKSIQGLHFPVSPEQFRAEFVKSFRRNPQLEKVYDGAKSCSLEFDAGQFGRVALSCDRAFTALRWILHTHSQSYELNLLNDTGSTSPVMVTRTEFEHPLKEVPLDPKLIKNVPTNGGLFVARVDQLSASIIVPPVVKNLSDFTGKVSPEPMLKTVNYLSLLTSSHRIWSDAKLPGNFAASMRRNRVLKWISLHIVGVLCGEPWRMIEVKTNPLVPALIAQLSRRREDEFIAREIASHAAKLTGQRTPMRIEFLFLLAKRSPRMAPAWLHDEEVREMVVLACQLLSHPESPAIKVGSAFESLAKRLLDYPTLCRAARLLVHATEPNPDNEAVPFPNWQDI